MADDQDELEPTVEDHLAHIQQQGARAETPPPTHDDQIPVDEWSPEDHWRRMTSRRRP